MKLRAAMTLAAVGLVAAGGGIAAASSSSGHPAGKAARPAAGRVIGRLEREGGPMGPGGQQPQVVPLAGTIVFSRPAHAQVRVHAGKSGRFTVRLAPGSYTVRGRAAGLPVCRYPGRLTIAAGRTSRITVACIVP
jgi:hypothetical protein